MEREYPAACREIPPSAPIQVLGISYKTAPVEVRERLAVSAAQLPAELARLRAAGLEETVLLSTCNRVEIYWLDSAGAAAAPRLLEEWKARGGAAVEGRTYAYQGLAAVVHLFRVAAGLDSMVLGEPQILGQVKAAYQAALQAKATGPRLNRLFQRALHAGKKARTETEIASGITSVASAAVVLAERIFRRLAGCSVTVLGAGKVAEAAAKHLISHKPARLFVANRTLARAQELAVVLGAQALAWDEAMARMPETDIVLCSTACPTFIISGEAVRGWIGARQGRPLFLIDIAVPRNVDPLVNGLDNVYLYDVDDLNGVVAEQGRRKRAEAERAEVLIRAWAEETSQAFAPAGAAPALQWIRPCA